MFAIIYLLAGFQRSRPIVTIPILSGLHDRYERICFSGRTGARLAGHILIEAGGAGRSMAMSRCALAAAWAQPACLKSFTDLNSEQQPLIPNPIDQFPWAHWRSPMDMMRQGWSTSLFHAAQQWSTRSS